MVEKHAHVMETAGEAHDRAAEILEDLISVASADRVYSRPAVSGDRTIITAAEIRTGMGFGYGFTAGAAAPAERTTGSDGKAATSSHEREAEDGEDGPRSGGGGGGQALGRPVAVITIGPEGVTVLPVLDRTRIALTALAAAGAIGLMLIRMRRSESRPHCR